MPPTGELDPAWSNVSTGITTYFGGVGVRILLAVVSFFVMRSGAGATSFAYRSISERSRNN